MSAQAQKSIFLLGGTGYLGSAVLSKFLTLNAQHTYTVLTRSEEKAKMIDDLLPGRVKAAQGSHQDLDLIEKLASENDITFNCADSDDVIQGLPSCCLSFMAPCCSHSFSSTLQRPF
jgi:nucleoside-diphosphate-sugar epimerase